MRLCVDVGYRLVALGLATTALAGCGLTGGDRPLSVSTSRASDATGPAADYPMVLGNPFTVDGEFYTPADVMNYDVVGYATMDQGSGVTLAHRTLPVPSYVEVTSLDTGKTILARVERRGPLSGSQFIALSPAAAAQLGASEGVAVRVRRVNPPERERAELRAGRPAPDRIETPKSLIEVLRRKLPASGAASLRAGAPPKPAIAAAKPIRASEVAPIPGATASAAPVRRSAPLAQASAASAVSKTDASASAGLETGFIVQAGTFSIRENADKAAADLGGHVSPVGKFYLVRTGPFASRAQAEAALAKVRAAGYSDARVLTAG